MWSVHSDCVLAISDDVRGFVEELHCIMGSCILYNSLVLSTKVKVTLWTVQSFTVRNSPLSVARVLGVKAFYSLTRIEKCQFGGRGFVQLPQAEQLDS